jgi:N,N'-diacetyllegionaminate synthase
MTKVLIIAEAGVNHNGCLKLAKKLVDCAVAAGANIIKFQTFQADELCHETAPKPSYQKKNSKKNENQFQMLKKLELTYYEYKKLKQYSQKKGIEFLSSAFDLSDLIFLKSLKLKRFKIPSGEITNYLYLKKIASFNKNIILSTGMSNFYEIEKAIRIIDPQKKNKKKITIMHCTSEYPADTRKINLKVIQTLKKKFGYNVGYSDHTTSIIVPALAVMMGATIIEKHLTLNKRMKGPDHRSSLNPKEFSKMVDQIRMAEMALGNGKKKISVTELKNAKLVRKSIFAKSNIKIGEKFTTGNLNCKRPDIGISAFKIQNFLGKKSKKNYSKNQIIK